MVCPLHGHGCVSKRNADSETVRLRAAGLYSAQVRQTDRSYPCRPAGQQEDPGIQAARIGQADAQGCLCIRALIRKQAQRHNPALLGTVSKLGVL